jgi:hypothetical protein
MIVQVRIIGLKLITPNATRFTTRGAAMAHAAKKRAIRDCVQAYVASVWRRNGDGMPTAITFRRFGPRRLDDDNLVAACKDPVDSVALALGVNDKTFVMFGDRPGIRLHFDQVAGREYGLEIDLECPGRPA